MSVMNILQYLNNIFMSASHLNNIFIDLANGSVSANPFKVVFNSYFAG